MEKRASKSLQEWDSQGTSTFLMEKITNGQVLYTMLCLSVEIMGVFGFRQSFPLVY